MSLSTAFSSGKTVHSPRDNDWTNKWTTETLADNLAQVPQFPHRTPLQIVFKRFLVVIVSLNKSLIRGIILNRITVVQSVKRQ